MKVFWLALAILTISAAFSQSANAGPTISAIKYATASSISERTFELSANKTLTLKLPKQKDDRHFAFFAPDGSELKSVLYQEKDGEITLKIIAKVAGTYTLSLLPNNFAEKSIVLQNIQANEELETVRMPNGAGSGHVLFYKATTSGPVTRVFGGGMAGAVRVRLNRNYDSLIVFLGVSNKKAGALRFYRNDYLIRDKDQDGLGDELEKTIGTCSTLKETVGGFDCSLASDPRDTDGDGISDGWETIGRSDLEPHQPLPLWGADPRHKDIFIEADFMRRSEKENQTRFVDHMNLDTIKWFQTVYTDSALGDESRLLANATTLRNPDGKPGINPHFDTGQEPTQPEDAALYGNWGGFNAVDAVSDGGLNWRGQNPINSYKSNMVASRYGIFRYLLMYTTGGASQGPGWLLAFNGHNGFISAHETGHSLGLGHSAPLGSPLPADVNCKPNYVSIMNYAFPYAGFSDGKGAPSLNNAALVESGAVDPENTYFLDVLEESFAYTIDRNTGSVDWNRNGLFEPRDQTVKAYANYKPGGNCEYTRYNHVYMQGTATRMAPSITRINNRLYVFYSNENGKTSYILSDSSWFCPKPLATGCDGGRWSQPVMVQIAAEQGLDVERIRIGGTEVGLLAATSSVGEISLNTLDLSRSDNAFSIISSQKLNLAYRAQGAPSLTFADGPKPAVYLSFKDTLNKIHLWIGIIGNEGISWEQTSNSQDLTASPTGSPFISFTNFPGRSEKALYGFFPVVIQGKEQLQIRVFDSESWLAVDDVELRQQDGIIFGRPSAAWGLDRLYVGYVRGVKDQGGLIKPGEMRMLWSFTKGNKNIIGLDSNFDNVWALSYGMDLFFEAGIDSNLRAVQANAINIPGIYGALQFRPKADGINDFEYENYNDWETLRLGLCTTIVDPSREISKQGLIPIVCSKN